MSLVCMLVSVIARAESFGRNRFALVSGDCLVGGLTHQYRRTSSFRAIPSGKSAAIQSIPPSKGVVSMVFDGIDSPCVVRPARFGGSASTLLWRTRLIDRAQPGECPCPLACLKRLAARTLASSSCAVDCQTARGSVCLSLPPVPPHRQRARAKGRRLRSEASSARTHRCPERCAGARVCVGRRGESGGVKQSFARPPRGEWARRHKKRLRTTTRAPGLARAHPGRSQSLRRVGGGGGFCARPEDEAAEGPACGGRRAGGGGQFAAGTAARGRAEGEAVRPGSASGG